LPYDVPPKGDPKDEMPERPAIAPWLQAWIEYNVRREVLNEKEKVSNREKAQEETREMAENQARILQWARAIQATMHNDDRG